VNSPVTIKAAARIKAESSQGAAPVPGRPPGPEVPDPRVPGPPPVGGGDGGDVLLSVGDGEGGDVAPVGDGDGEPPPVGDGDGLIEPPLGDGDGDDVPPPVGDGVGLLVEHDCRVIVLESKVTAPLRASVRPSTVAFVFSVFEVKARMLPLKRVFVPSVAELPTFQKTLQD
jgi:hypothetical protein